MKLLFFTIMRNNNFNSFEIMNFNLSAAWSPYWEHLKEAWARKDHPNLLFLFYEELQVVSLYKNYYKST